MDIFVKLAWPQDHQAGLNLSVKEIMNKEEFSVQELTNNHGEII